MSWGDEFRSDDSSEIDPVRYQRETKTGWLEPHPNSGDLASATRVIANPLYSAGWFLANENPNRSDFVTTKFRTDEPKRALTETLKEWLMVLLMLVFVVLYAMALVGTLKPLADLSMVSRLEPILFVIIGYYFGRLPAQQNEQTLKNEIDRQSKRAEAAQQARETALQSRDALDEKVKNARTALATKPLDGNTETPGRDTSELHQRGSVAAAFNILKS